MSSLLQRARALICSKPAILGALAIVPLASAARMAEAGPTAGPYSFTSGTAFIPGTSGETLSGTLSAIGSNPLRLNTSGAITVSASTYISDSAPSVDLKWNGTLNNTFFPMNTSAIGVNYDFILGLSGSGGSVSWTLKNNIGGIELDTSSSGSESQGSDEFTGSLSAPVTSTVTGSWTSELDVFWSPGGQPATLSINVPGATSIDLGVTNTPEPASLSVLGLGAVGLLIRRRRK